MFIFSSNLGTVTADAWNVLAKQAGWQVEDK